jgi:hypothetical protein
MWNCDDLTCFVTHFSAIVIIGLDIALLAGASLDRNRDHAPYVLLATSCAIVGWVYIEVLLLARHCAYASQRANIRPKAAEYYMGEALAAPLASVGLTAVAVWTAFRGGLGTLALAQYDIWVRNCVMILLLILKTTCADTQVKICRFRWPWDSKVLPCQYLPGFQES